MALTVLVWLAGGMKAPGLVRYVVYVMMAALLSSRNYALFFSIISTIVFISLYILNNTIGIDSNILVPFEKFHLIYFLISLGVLFFSTLLVFQYIKLYDNYHKQFEEKNNEINTLLRVLIHDTSNPLTIAKYHAMKPKEDSNKKIVNLLDVINLTIDSVRKLKASEDGKL